MNSRQKLISEIPIWYSPVLHALVPPTIGIIIFLLCLVNLHNILIFEVLLSLLFLFIMFGIEWFLHKYVLHNSFLGFKYLLRMHSRHHHLYRDHSMQLQHINELYYILVPIYSIGLIFLGLLPFSLLGLIFSINLSLMIMMTGILFFMIYEAFHLSYHMPHDSWMFKLVNKLGLSNLHTTHHRVENMKKYNFNVTFPVFDKLLGTYKNDIK